jgi:ribosomal protein S18 acetylase RimI-like enzyme
VSDADLLAVFDLQVRRDTTPPQPGWLVERAGQVIRVLSSTTDHGCYVEWSDLDESTADAAIAETVARYRDLGHRRFEWKTYGYDGPADLPERLVRAGFVAEEVESLVLGPVDEVVTSCAGAELPGEVSVRVVSRADDPAFAGISDLHSAVWGEDSEHWVDALRDEVLAVPDSISVLVAEVIQGAETQVVCAAWVRFQTGTGFASLWGGSTLPAWRHRGIYRTLVGQRAVLAAERGYRYLRVDASPDSRPILERLGLRVLTTTTPYVWRAPDSR